MQYDISLWEEIQKIKLDKREKRRKEKLQEAISLLKKYFKNKTVDEVFIVGSILQKNKFYEFSDIDIAVLGLKENYFRTLSELEDLLNMQVDLIELEKCHFKEKLLESFIKIK